MMNLVVKRLNNKNKIEQKFDFMVIYACEVFYTFHAYLHILFFTSLRNVGTHRFLNFLNNCLITARLNFGKNVVL